MWLNFILLLFLCVLLLSKYGRLRASANKDTNDIYQEFIGFSGFSKAFILEVKYVRCKNRWISKEKFSFEKRPQVHWLPHHKVVKCGSENFQQSFCPALKCNHKFEVL